MSARQRSNDVKASARAPAAVAGVRNMTKREPTAERVEFRRHRELPGVETLLLRDSARCFSCYSADYEFVVPDTWRGEIRHGKDVFLLEPGAVLCNRPGDAFSALKVHEPGSMAALLIEPHAFEGYLAEHDVAPEAPAFRTRTQVTPALAAQLRRLFEAFVLECSALELQSHLAEFFALALPELIRPPHSRPARADPNALAAERMRACLEADATDSLDLEALAREVGLSRFQALRAFKRAFGLPPHAYRLRKKVAVARRSLRGGARVADVAASCGFVDESHLGRHFKRHFGVTPAEYARAAYR
jgi:AraC-like DNA-binding protein